MEIHDDRSDLIMQNLYLQICRLAEDADAIGFDKRERINFERSAAHRDFFHDNFGRINAHADMQACDRRAGGNIRLRLWMRGSESGNRRKLTANS